MKDPGGAIVRFRHDYWFPVTPEALWAILERFDRYPTWWRWLRDLTVTPADGGLSSGTELRGTIIPPLPGRLTLRVTLDRCRAPALIEATVEGEVRGPATLELVAHDGGTTVTAQWTLQLAKTRVRLAARVAAPVARWAHDQVVAMAVEGFRRHALTDSSRPAGGPSRPAQGRSSGRRHRPTSRIRS